MSSIDHLHFTDFYVDAVGRTFGNNDQDDFRVVSGVLRLATKYLIDSLRAKALAHLHIAWPLDLKAWDAREDVLRSYEIEASSRNPQGHHYPPPFVSDLPFRDTYSKDQRAKEHCLSF